MVKRRGRGEGSIRRRPDGTYEARVSLGCDGSGRRKSRSVYAKTRGEVQAKLRKVQDEAGRGVLAEPTALTLGQYLDAWLSDVAKAKTSPATWERYESLARLHVKPHLGGVRLSAVTPLHVQRLNGEIARAGGSAWTQKMAATLLHNALRHAVRVRLIPANPAADVPRAKPAEKAVAFLSGEQVRQLLAAARGRRLYALFALAVGSGMRQGEMLGLAWDAVDFESGQVTVRRSLVQYYKKREGDRFVLKEPKSRQSKRTIKLPAFAVDALREHRARAAAEGHGSPFVFTTRTGQFIGRSNLTRQVFRPALRAAGLPQIRVHDLRHTHASALLNGGASIKAVSHRLGHSSVELTLRVYAHVLPDADETLAGQAEALFA